MDRKDLFILGWRKKASVRAASTVRVEVQMETHIFAGDSDLIHIVTEPMRVSDIAKRKQK